MEQNVTPQTPEACKYRFGEHVITKAQARVVSLMLHGLIRKQIADLLGNSTHTVNKHIENVYKELGINDCKLLTRWAIRNAFDDYGNVQNNYLFDGYENLPWQKRE